jgi:hypothetical protein
MEDIELLTSQQISKTIHDSNKTVDLSDYNTSDNHNLEQKLDKSARQCMVCGDTRHFTDRCYSATSDGFLSLTSLAFWNEVSSDIKIQSAMSHGCILHGQPATVITEIRNIVNRIRKQLTTTDRERNIKHKRESRNNKKNNVHYPEVIRISKPIVLLGAIGNLKITEESVFMQSACESNNEESSWDQHTLVKKVASLKIASANNKLEIEHEASYDVTTLQHNMIKTGDNNDISMCLFYEKLISKTIISNKSLVFIKFSVGTLQPSDVSLIDINKNQIAWLHDTSNVINNDDTRKEFAIQMDNGAAQSITSREFANYCKATIVPLQKPINLMAFNKSIVPVTHYAVFVIAVKGISINSIEGHIIQTREFLVTALITDTEETLILGSEFISQQNIVFDPQMRHAVFFYGVPHAMIVDMVPWDEIKEKLTAPNIIIRSIKLLATEAQNKGYEQCKIKNTTQLLIENIKHTCVILDKREYTDCSIQKIHEHKSEVFKDIKLNNMRWIILAVIIFSKYMQSLTLTLFSTDNRHVNQCDLYQLVANRANFPVSIILNIKMSKKLITHDIKTYPHSWYMKFLTEMQTLVNTILKETITAIYRIFLLLVKELLQLQTVMNECPLNQQDYVSYTLCLIFVIETDHTTTVALSYSSITSKNISREETVKKNC